MYAIRNLWDNFLDFRTRQQAGYFTRLGVVLENPYIWFKYIVLFTKIHSSLVTA